MPDVPTDLRPAGSSSTGGAGRLPTGIHLTGEGLQLREWADADLDVMVELFDDPQIDRWTPLGSPFNRVDARAYLEQARVRRAEGISIQLAITIDNREALGEVLLFPSSLTGRAPDGRLGEIGYTVGAAHRRRGLAHRAVRLLTSYAYQQLNVDAVILRIDPENTASAAVARAAGFDFAGEDPLTRHDARPLHIWQHRESPAPPGRRDG